MPMAFVPKVPAFSRCGGASGDRGVMIKKGKYERGGQRETVLVSFRDLWVFSVN